MQIVFAGVNGELELELRINRPSATVADLDAALPATGASGPPAC